MNLNEVEIEVKHSGLLEVPAGKEVDQLPQAHFQKLIDKKGYEAIIRGLTNLEVWNKNKNPKLSQWASSMADKLKKANHKDESYSQRFQQALDEINAKTAAKISTNIYRATKSGASKFAKGAGEAIKRAGTTAQNAIVAGAAAPVGVKIANTYSTPKKKEQKYSASDVAAIAAALKKSESYSDRFKSCISVLEEKIEKKKNHLKDATKTVAGATAAGAGIGGGLGGGMLGGAANVGARALGFTQRRGVGKLVRRGLTALGGTVGGSYGAVTGAAKGLIGGAALAAGKYAYDKHKEHKAKMKSKSESLKEGIERLDAFLEFARKKSDNQSHYKKLPESPVKKTQKKIMQNAQRVSGNTPTVDPTITAKRKAAAEKGARTKAANAAAKQKALEAQINKPLIDAATKTSKTKTVSDVAKTAGERAAKAKEIFKGSEAMKKALKHKAFVGGLKGAAIATGLGAAAYGVHKYRNRDNY